MPVLADTTLSVTLKGGFGAMPLVVKKGNASGTSTFYANTYLIDSTGSAKVQLDGGNAITNTFDINPAKAGMGLSQGKGGVLVNIAFSGLNGRLVTLTSGYTLTLTGSYVSKKTTVKILQNITVSQGSYKINTTVPLSVPKGDSGTVTLDLQLNKTSLSTASCGFVG
jgi:hypothetical protein